MKPLFSIIIPVFNARKWLQECLDSVRSQSFQDWEAILIDDGSSDDSGIVCDEYAQMDSRFKVIHQENKGVSHARNVGLQQITGEYILFVDSDDMLLSNALFVLSDCMAKHPDCDIVQFGYQEDNNRYCSTNTFWGTSDDFFSKGFLPLRTVWGTLFKKELTTKFEFTRGVPVGEDTEYSAKCYFEAKYLGVITAALYIYRKDSTSVMRSKSSLEKVRSILTVIQHLEQDIKPKSEVEINAKRLVIEQLRMSFHQMLSRMDSSKKELLAEYRKQDLLPAKYIRALRLADVFPELYYFYLKHIRNVS